MSKMKKMVIPVAGLGTRVLPASKAIPKEMLTVVDKPVIQYVVEEAVAAGFTDIIFVTRNGKAAIEDHFDSHFELETSLGRKGKTDLLDTITAILPDNVTISSVRQNAPLGLGHAVLCAAPLIGDDDFAVSLPDVLVHSPDGYHATDLINMVNAYRDTGSAQIMVESVPQEDVTRYGIVDCEGVDLQRGDASLMVGSIEKPSVEEAPSNLSIIGRYLLPAHTLELLRRTTPGAGGEIQLTDAIADLLKEQKVYAYSMKGKTCDCGHKLGYMSATITFGLSHETLGEPLADFLKGLDIT